MVLHSMSSFRNEDHLSNNKIQSIVNLWEKHLTESKEEDTPRTFRQITRDLLVQANREGVFFGTMKELAEETNHTPYTLRKNFDLLEKHGLIFRRKGIIVVNKEAFSEKKIKKITKDNFKW